MLYLLHAGALMQLYNPLIVFCLFFPFSNLCVLYRWCTLLSKLLWQWKCPAEGGFSVLFWTMIMDLWVEFWKFVSKCFQVFTWPYVYISIYDTSERYV